MTVKQMGEPDLDSWNEQQHRQRRASRNRKLGAITVAAVLVITGAVVAIGAIDSADGPPGTPASEPTLPVEPGAEPTHAIVDVGSGTATPFTAPLGAWDFESSPDGSMIAYGNFDEDGNEQVFVMDADGSNPRQLTHGEEPLLNNDLTGCSPCSGLAWSPDGSMIAYQQETPAGPPQIFTVRTSDEVSVQVTNEPQGAVQPGGWAPDGGSILYMVPNYDINHYSAMSVDLETGRTEQIVPDASSPELSPDGSMIAFNSWTGRHIRLIVANSDDSERRVIARFDDGDAFQEWSPDSTRIAFAATLPEHGFGTYVYDLNTGKTSFVADGTIVSWTDDDHILVS